MRRAIRCISIQLMALLIAFSVLPAIQVSAAGLSVSPSIGRPGAGVSVTGTGFAANETGINVTWDGTIIASNIAASPTGGWNASFSVPSAASGGHVVAASGSVTTTAVTTTFTVTPYITISRGSAPPGTSIQVLGYGFGANESGITVTLDGNSVASGTSASPNGTWGATFTVPAAGAGSHSISAFGTTTSLSSVNPQSLTITANIAINRLNGPPGTTVLITGSGFAAYESGITITFDGNPLGTTASADGSGAWNTNFAVPPAPGGAHSIGAYGPSTPSGTAPILSFTVSSGISLSKTTAPPGTSISVNGSGFAANENGINLTYDGQPIGQPINANGSGIWTSTFIVPDSAAGAHAIGASGTSTSSSTVSSVTFTIAAGLTIDKTSGPAGTPVTVTGIGFAANESGITVTYDGSSVTQPTSASATGGWTASFNVPQSGSGRHAITAFGASTASGAAPSLSFNILSTLAINQKTGTPGTNITVTGTGFGASETGISVLYDSLVTASNIRADTVGNWSASFVAPASPAGPHVISARGPITSQIGGSDTSFRISSILSAVPLIGYIGSTVTLSGSGFAASSDLIVAFDNANLLTEKAVTSDTAGSFKANITIPKAKSGSHTIKVSDSAQNEARVSFSIDSTPPSVPTPLYPEDGARIGLLGDNSPNLTWTAVSSPNGVSYELEVDKTSTFSSPLLSRSDISGNHYTFAKSEALPLGEYYWRVRAIDGASNQSAWSSPVLLRSGLMSLATLLILIALAIIIVGGLIYLIVIRPRRRRKQIAQPVLVPQMEAPEPITAQLLPPESPSIQLRMLGPATNSPPEGSPAPKALPYRLALPQPVQKDENALSAEDQARLKVIIEFAKSLPLLEPGYNLNWFVELAESNTGTESGPALFEQIVRGEVQPHYEPAWMRHPTFQDLTTLLEGQPVLQDLNSFLDSINRCAAMASQLLGEINQAIGSEVPADFFTRGGWNFISGVYIDSLAWFQGKYLKEPAEKDYTVKVDGNGEGEAPTYVLSGESSTPFAGILIQGISQEEANMLKGLHFKLRRTYRDSQTTQDIVHLISQISVKRKLLMESFSQMGNLSF